MRRQLITTSVFILLVLIGVMSRTAFSQGSPSDSTDIQREMVRSLAERFGLGTNWANCGYSIGVDRAGRVTGLNGIQFRPDSTNSMSEWAYRFLETNRDIFDIENPRQELPLSKNAHGTVEMYQVVNSIKVLNAYVQFGLNSDASVAYIDFSCYPEARNVNTTPSIDSLQAFSIARSDPQNENHPAKPLKAKLMIAKFNNDFHLVWTFILSGGGYFDGESRYFIDAHDGSVLKIGRSSIE
jgi:hypothetical protein